MIEGEEEEGEKGLERRRYVAQVIRTAPAIRQTVLKRKQHSSLQLILSSPHLRFMADIWGGDEETSWREIYDHVQHYNIMVRGSIKKTVEFSILSRKCGKFKI